MSAKAPSYPPYSSPYRSGVEIGRDDPLLVVRSLASIPLGIFVQPGRTTLAHKRFAFSANALCASERETPFRWVQGV